MIRGIIRKIRKNKNGFYVELLSKEGIKKLFSNFYIEEKRYVELELEGEKITFFKYLEGADEFLNKIRDSIDVPEIKPLITNETTLMLSKDISFVVKKIKEANLFGRETLVRFNNDADGISSALLLKEVLNAFYIQHNAPIYFKKDAFNDLNSLLNRFKPLLFLLDFGANEESKEALEIISSYGIEVIIIDHHPFNKEIEKFAKLISPHKYGGESNITTGYICYEIARAFSKSSEELLKISLAGDKSDILNVEEEYKEKALIIDYVANYVNYGGKLDLYKEVLTNKELMNTLRIQALEKMEEAKEIVKKNFKKTNIGGLNIYEIKLESISRDDFPSRSKMTTQLYELFKDENAIFLGITNRSIIFRISEKAYKNGISAKEIIENIKEGYPNIVESGGGHDKAASIRVREEKYLDFVKEEVKKYLKDFLEKGKNER